MTRPRILGVVNATPDSFSGGNTLAEAVHSALEMIDAGVDAVDVGGESTRPGASEVAAEAEIARVVPVISEIMKLRPRARVGVDTRKSRVARAAVEAGARIVNDVGMLEFDPEMAATAAELGCGLVIAHNRGTPQTMNELAVYEDVVSEVYAELASAVEKALAAGVKRDKIIVDPNLGFAKNTAHNLDILKNVEKFRELGFPVMVGHSRKRFIGELCSIERACDRDAVTLGLSAALAGRADWLRVHDAVGHIRFFDLLDRIN